MTSSVAGQMNSAAGPDRLKINEFAISIEKGDYKNFSACLARFGRLIVNARTDGTTELLPLMVAIYHGRKDMVDELIDHGAEVNYSRDGQNPLIAAVRARRLHPRSGAAMVEAMLARGADPNQRLDAGKTALMLAAASGEKDICLLMFNRSADIGIRDDAGLTAIDHARREGQGATADTLEEAMRARDEAIQENEVRNFVSQSGTAKPVLIRAPLRLTKRGA